MFRDCERAGGLRSYPAHPGRGVGVGDGKYSALYRAVGQEWIGVEIWVPFIREYALATRYDPVIVADARYLDMAVLGLFEIMGVGVGFAGVRPSRGGL